MIEVPISDRWNPLGCACRSVGRHRVLQTPFYLMKEINKKVKMTNYLDFIEHTDYLSIDLLHLLRRQRSVCQFPPVKWCLTVSQTRQFLETSHQISNAAVYSTDARFHMLHCRFLQAGDELPIHSINIEKRLIHLLVWVNIKTTYFNLKNYPPLWLAMLYGVIRMFLKGFSTNILVLQRHLHLHQSQLHWG